MLFNTPQFGVFLFVVFFLYWMTRGNRAMRYSFLLACSYYFYMCWNVKYLGLILFSTLLDFILGRAIFEAPGVGRKKLYLTLSILGNLGVLGTFKYFNFFAENVNTLGSLIGLEPFAPHLSVLLPVGISFYTFQTMSYTIEIYKGKLEPCPNIIEFALFVSFFPQLVAGPIVRASEFIPQLDREPELSDNRISSGIYTIVKGLFKKMIIGDYIAILFVDKVFANPAAYGPLTILLAAHGFRLQIYGDFAGYSDIAIGSARLLGFDLPINFKAPYKATSFPDYWRRWHLTMAAWFRDFVYYPLGGSRKGNFRAYINLLLTMAAVGLWHGASWTFVSWGMFYGVILTITRFVNRRRKDTGPREQTLGQKAFGFLFVFNLLVIPNILFRAESMSDVGIMFQKMFSLSGWELDIPPTVLFVLVLGYGTHFLPELWKQKIEEYFCRAPALAQAVFVGALLGAFIILSFGGNPFYYFQF